MLDYDIMCKLTEYDTPYVYINELSKEVTFSTEKSNYYPTTDDTNRVFHMETHFTMPVGENLFNFIAISPHDIKMIRGLIETTSYNPYAELKQNSEERFIASLDCVYLYLLYYSSFREKLANDYTCRLDRIQKEFEFALNFCCNDGFIPELLRVSPMVRFYVYTQLYDDNFNTNDRTFSKNRSLFLEPNRQCEALNLLSRMDLNNPQYRFMRQPNMREPIVDKPSFPPGFSSALEGLEIAHIFRYSYAEIEGYLMEELFFLIKSGMRVKKCRICEKYFITKGNYATDCCDRIQEGQKFTCKKIAAIRVRKEKLNRNPVLKEYEKFYKRVYARFSNHKLTKTEYNQQIAGASEKRDSIIQEYGDNPPDDILTEFKAFLGNR